MVGDNSQTIAGGVFNPPDTLFEGSDNTATVVGDGSTATAGQVNGNTAIANCDGRTPPRPGMGRPSSWPRPRTKARIPDTDTLFNR